MTGKNSANTAVQNTVFDAVSLVQRELFFTGFYDINYDINDILIIPIGV